MAVAPAEPAAQAADDGLLGGRFKLGAQIGGNRTGEVYDATDTSGGSPCVVKLVHGPVFPSPLLRQRTERELKQLERVQCASVARVLAHGKQGDRLWVACEKIDGQPLKSVVAQGALSVDRARAIILSVGEALAEAAKVGVIHRDVSPKNILVVGDSVKVINFGIPTPLTDRVQGEPEFLSPEQVEGKPVDQRSNIYSLGAVLYYMVTGRPPYTGDANAVMQAHLAGKLTPPSQVGAVAPSFEAIIVKALDRVSSRRFMTLRQLLTEIAQADATGAADSASSTTPFVAGGKSKDKAAAHTMMGMLAPGIGPDSKPTDIVVVAPGAAQAQPGAPAPAAAVATFAQPTPQPQAAQPAPQRQAPQPAPQPQAPQPAPQPQAPQPQSALGGPPGPSLPASPSVPSGPTGSAGGKRGKAAAKKKKARKKGEFRETLWFKKGDLDAVAAEAAAAQAAKDALVSDKADQLPIEDRYKDDGTVTTNDQQSYSLRTGHTQMMNAVEGSGSAGAGMANDELVGEMKGGRMKFILAIVVGAILIGALVTYFVLH